MADKHTHIIVDSVPTSFTSEVLPWMSGVLVPILILLIGWLFARKAESSANKFTIRLFQHEKDFSQRSLAIDILNMAYENLYLLKTNNTQRKIWEKHAKELSEINDDILKKNNMATLAMHQDNMKTVIMKNTNLESMQAGYVVKLHSCLGRLGAIIDEGETKALYDMVITCTRASKNAGAMTDEMVTKVSKEIDRLVSKLSNSEIGTNALSRVDIK